MEFFNDIEMLNKIILNDQQKAAVTHNLGPALVLAGPGSGKTAVIITRLAWLVSVREILPSNILSMAFNRAAAKEMQERCNKLFCLLNKSGNSSTTYSARFSTIHAFCWSVLRSYAARKGMKLNLIEEGGRQVIRNLYKELTGEDVYMSELLEMIRKIGYLKSKRAYKADCTVNTTISSNAVTDVIRQLADTYDRYKMRNSLVDFDDMPALTLDVFNREREILNFYRRRYRYIQVDEGQDLSEVQHEIVRLLAEPCCNLFMVADDDQSIYSFRGAEPQYILDFGNRYRGAAIYHLEQNYRSSAEIVALSSMFIKNNNNRFDKGHFTVNGNSGMPVILDCENERVQVQRLVSEVENTIILNPRGNCTNGATAQYKGAAVLFRNNISMIAVIDRFLKKSIAFSVPANDKSGSDNGFMGHWLNDDIKAFMQFARNRTDASLFGRIYNKTSRFIPKEAYDHAVEKSDAEYQKKGNRPPFMRLLLDCPYLSTRHRTGIVEMSSEFGRLSRMDAAKALEYIESTFRYMEGARRYCDIMGDSFSAAKNIMTALKLIADDKPDQAVFLRRIGTIMRRLQGTAADTNLLETGYGRITGILEDIPVTLATVHSAKGLEFDTVFITDVAEGEFPSAAGIEESLLSENNETIEQERRLFYVAITRAKRNLIVFSLKTKNRLAVEKSRFVSELEQCIQQVNIIIRLQNVKNI